MKHVLTYILLIPLVFTSSYGVEVERMTQLGEEFLSVGQGLIALDDTDYGAGEVTYYSKVSMRYDRLSHSDVEGKSWRIGVTYDIVYADELGEEVRISGNYLELNRGMEGLPVYEALSRYDHQGEVMLVIQNVVREGDVPFDLFLELSLVSEGVMTLETSSPIVGYDGVSKEVWWGYVYGAEEYDMEWVFIDYQDTEYSNITAGAAAFAHSEGIGVTTNDQFFPLEPHYYKGKVFVRVRGKGVFTSNPGQVRYGSWGYGEGTDVVINVDNPALKSQHFQSVMSFAEEGKHKQVVSYMDASLRTRQVQTELSTSHHIAVIENKFDYEGRAVLELLPSIMSKPSGLSKAYKANLNTFVSSNGVTATGTKADYEVHHLPLSTTSGTGKYYSSSQESLGGIHADYTADAGGYAYSQIIYEHDGKGRVSKISGTGLTKSLAVPTASAHYDRYYYTEASETELKRLFGSNVGSTDHYKKVISIDANNQGSVQYLDSEGRLIASGILGNSASTGLEDVDGAPTTPTSLPIALSTNSEGGGDQLIRKSINTIVKTELGAQDYTFNYSLEGVSRTIDGICQECRYQVDITVYDESGVLVPGSHHTEELNGNGTSTPCEGGNYSITPLVVSLPAGVGEYTIVKELSLAEDAISTLVTTAGTTTTYPDLTDTEDDFLDDLDYSGCDITCAHHCETSVLATHPTWDDRHSDWDGQDHSNDIAVEVDLCLVANCNTSELVQEVFEDNDAIGCGSLLQEMGKQFEPGEIYNDGGTFDLVNTASISGLDFTNSQGDVLDDQPTLSDLQDEITFQSQWGKTLALEYHPELHFYDNCREDIASGSFSYEIELAQIVDWNDAIATGYIDPLNMSQAPWSSADAFDPFFQSGSRGSGTTSDDMRAAMLDYDNSQSLWSYVSNTTELYNSDGVNPTVTEKWNMFRGLYLALKNEHKEIANQRDFNCTGENCYYLGEEHAINKPVEDIPEDAEGVVVFTAEHMEEHCSGLCEENVAIWMDRLYLDDSENFPAEGSQAYIDIETHLENKCLSDCGLSNPMAILGPYDANDGFWSHLGTLVANAEVLAVDDPYEYSTTHESCGCLSNVFNSINHTYYQLGGSGGRTYLSFDGDDQVGASLAIPANVSTGKGLNGQDSRTLEAWIKIDDGVTNSGSIITYGDPSIDGGWFDFGVESLSSNVSVLRLSLSVGPLFYKTGSIDIKGDGWHHVAVIGGSSLNATQFYIDGVLDPGTVYGSGTMNTQVSNNSASGTIGDGFVGDIDEVRIWTKELDVNTLWNFRYGISMSYSDPLNHPHPAIKTQNLASYWPFYEGEGTVTHDITPPDYNTQLPFASSSFNAPTWGSYSSTPSSNTIPITVGVATSSSSQLSSICMGSLDGIEVSATGELLGTTSGGYTSPLVKMYTSTGQLVTLTQLASTGQISTVDITDLPSGLSSTQGSYNYSGQSMTVKYTDGTFDQVYLYFGSATPTAFSDCGAVVVGLNPTASADWSFDWNPDDYRTNCVTLLEDNAIYDANQEYQQQVTDYLNTHLGETALKCFDQPFDEHFSYSTNAKEFLYTLYYYDQAGNLVQTVPPAGVDLDGVTFDSHGEYVSGEPSHTLKTRYIYNTFNELVWEHTPDGGESYTWYDGKGRVRLSQNSHQTAQSTPEANKYSYIKYDELSRPSSSGQLEDYSETSADLYLESNQLSTFTLLDDEDFPLITASRSQVTTTVYDGVTGTSNISQSNLRNRVSTIFYLEDPTDIENQTATYYSYDIHGNLKEVEQVIPHIGSKIMSYDYDLISGNVHEVYYQKGRQDQFVHHYNYDADNRITSVETSKDGYIWSSEARYQYYLHGPLARVELGEDNIQGQDYYYTLENWLKGVNTPHLAVNNESQQDVGQDGIGGVHQWVAQDEFAYGLGYHVGDYTPINSAVDMGVVNDVDLFTAQGNGINNQGLYNGNIVAMITHQKSFGHQTDMSITDPVRQDAFGLKQSHYKYDQLNRLKQVTTMNDYITQWTSTELNRDKVNFSYDFNGNITFLNRWNGATVKQDELIYDYTKNGTGQLVSNRLNYVQDAQGNVTGNDLDNQSSTNYGYDQLGRLVKDESNDIATITWTVTNKVKEVIKTGDFPNQEFRYDAAGNRIMKIVKEKASGIVEPAYKWDYTYYSRDAGGNVMSQYTRTYNQNNNEQTYRWIEVPIYGSSRVGVYEPNEILATYTTTEEEIVYTNTASSRTAYIASDFDQYNPGINGDYSAHVQLDPTNASNQVIRSGGAGDASYLTLAAISVHAGDHINASIRSYKTQAGEGVRFVFKFMDENGNTPTVNQGANQWFSVSQTSANQWETLTFDHVVPNNIVAKNVILKLEVWKHSSAVETWFDDVKVTIHNGSHNTRNQKAYELSNHLGNVYATVSDYKEGVDTDGDDVTDYYQATPRMFTDYHAFGSGVAGRDWYSENYRYGFNGMEKDNDLKGKNNSYDFGARIYDTRIGRFISVDPIKNELPHISPFNFAENSVIEKIDKGGLSGESYRLNLTVTMNFGFNKYTKSLSKSFLFKLDAVRMSAANENNTRYSFGLHSQFRIKTKSNWSVDLYILGGIRSFNPRSEQDVLKSEEEIRAEEGDKFADWLSSPDAQFLENGAVDMDAFLATLQIDPFKTEVENASVSTGTLGIGVDKTRNNGPIKSKVGIMLQVTNYKGGSNILNSGQGKLLMNGKLDIETNSTKQADNSTAGITLTLNNFSGTSRFGFQVQGGLNVTPEQSYLAQYLFGRIGFDFTLGKNEGGLTIGKDGKPVGSVSSITQVTKTSK